MDRQSFPEELRRFFKNEFLNRIHARIEQQFEDYRQIIRYISALDRKSDPHKAIREGLPSVLNAVSKEIDKDHKEQLYEAFEDGLAQIDDEFPSRIEWEQTEERFAVQDDDSWNIAISKNFKSLLRSTSHTCHAVTTKFTLNGDGSVNGWTPWLQTIPLQNVIRYHLSDSDVIIHCMNRLERFPLQLILQIENLLVSNSKYAQSEENNRSIDFDEFAGKLLTEAVEQERAIKKGVTEEIDELKSDILQEIEKAGTIERREQYYRDSKLESRKDEVGQKFQWDGKQWTEAHYLLLGQAELILEFFSMHSDLIRQCNTLSDDIDNYFETTLLQPLDELHEMLEQDGQQNSVEELQQLKNVLMDQMERLVTTVRKGLDKQIFSAKVEHFFDNLLLRANQLEENRTLLYEMELDRNPPKLEHREMEWRLLVVRSIREHLVGEVQPLQKQYHDFFTTVLQQLQEMAGVIEVNLESAIEEKKADATESKEDPAAIIREALQRVLGNVEQLQKQSEERRKLIGDTVSDGYRELRDSLLALIREGDLRELQLLNAKYKAKETTKGWKTIINSRLAGLEDRVSVWMRFGWRKVKAASMTVGIFLGFQQKQLEKSKRADIATYLSETDQKMRELPYIYRRLFNFDAVADERFYVPIMNAASTFRRSYERWQQSIPTTFAMVGEKGSGKSTFLNFMVETELTNHQPVQVEMNDTISTEPELVELFTKSLEIKDVETVQDIVKQINSWSKPRVICIENVQNSFVRNLNGYEAVEKLCYLISETKQQVFWVVSCSRYAWRFLDKTVQLSEYFTHLATCDTLEADQIKKVILNRHRSSGYTLHFEAGDEAISSRSYRKLMDQEDEAQKYLQENYFEKLTTLAEGNASVAMIFWIRSIREFDDTYCYIEPLEVTSVEMIEDLDQQVLFTLAAFVMHDTLIDEDLTKILNITAEESRLMLNRLHGRGLLVKEEEGFTINHLMYRQIVRVLKERNIIHLV